MKTGHLAALAVAAGITLGTGAQMVRAQAARAYTWYAELASVDQNAKTVTFKVQIRDGVARYVGSYKPGDKLMLTWVPITGEADSVVYAPKYEVMKGIDEGFILPVEFVAADTANKSMTVRAAAPPPVLQTLQALPAGRWFKVVTPMKQPAETAVLTSAAATEKPDLKPPPPPTPPPAPAGGRGGRGGAASPVSGDWSLVSQLAGNSLPLECKFTVQGTALTGTCGGQLGESPVMRGELTDTTVKFGLELQIGGMSLSFDYNGTVTGTTM